MQNKHKTLSICKPLVLILIFFSKYLHFLHHSPFIRCGQCGAWSYNDVEGDCYLHTADACCGQKGNQEANSDWISGYFCIKCWSTEAGADCPCSLQKRLEGQLGCSLAQSSGAADDPQYKNPTVSII